MALGGRVARLLALVGAGLLYSVGAARAQYFNFTTTFTPNPVPASAGGQLTITNGQNLTGVFAGLNGSDIVLTNIDTVSSAPDTSPETVNSNYTITVGLQMSSAGGTATSGWIYHDFLGNLSGTISTNSSNISNTNVFVPETYDFGGGNVFTVFRNSYVPPGAPGAHDHGAIGAHVSGPLSVPEPGSLSLLLGSGVGGSFFMFRRRRRA